MCQMVFALFVLGAVLCPKIVIEYQFAKIICTYTALLSLYIVWMAVQIMLPAESLLPACERTAMHEKKDSYVFSMHGILPSLLSLT